MWLHETYLPILIQNAERIALGFEDDADCLLAVDQTSDTIYASSAIRKLGSL